MQPSPPYHLQLRLALGRSLSRLRYSFDEFTAGPAEPDEDIDFSARPNRRLLWMDGLFSNISESFVTNFLNPFAMTLGATNGQIGLLSAMTNLTAALGLAPGARLSERSGKRKQIAVLSGGLIGRLLLPVAAALPAFLGAPAIMYAVIAIIALRSFVNQVGYPAWSALVADLVPKAIRGRYFAARNIGLAVAALVFTPLAGYIIDLVGGVRGYQVSLIIACLVGLVATSIFARIKEPPLRLEPKLPKAQSGRVVALLRAHPQFAAFTGVALVWNLALMVAGPFFSVYLVRTLHGTPTQIGILAAVNAMGNIVGQRLWGQLNDQHGAVWVTRLTGLLIPVVPLGWSLAPNPWWLVPAEIFSGFTWAGYGLASFNLLLGLSPEPQRERFIALYQIVVFGAACVGPLAGSVLADALTIRPLLWISCAGRLAAALLFLFTVRADAEAIT